MKRHKHADVLIAIAEGREVEYYSEVREQWEYSAHVNPIYHDALKWRIKPEPKVELI